MTLIIENHRHIVNFAISLTDIYYSMKKTLLSCLVSTLLMLPNAKAQSKLTMDQKAELFTRFRTYREKLKLDDKQEVKVRAIDSIYVTGLAETRGSRARRAAKLQKIKQLSATRDAEMKKVLTAVQFKQYGEFKDDMRGEFRGLRKRTN